MDCARLSATDVFGMSWADENTLLAAVYFRRQLWKYTLSTTAKTCRGELMDSGYVPNDVACWSDGKCYVPENIGRATRVRIYDMNAGTHETWDLSISTGFTRIAVNNEFIVVTPERESFVYNKEREFLYKIVHTQMGGRFHHTHITDTNKFIGTGRSHIVLIYDLETREMNISRRVMRAFGVSGTRQGYIFVQGEMNEIGVYSHNGEFLHFLQTDLPENILYFESSAYKTKVGESFMALEPVKNLTSPIRISRLSP